MSTGCRRSLDPEIGRAGCWRAWRTRILPGTSIVAANLFLLKASHLMLQRGRRLAVDGMDFANLHAWARTASAD
jgi:hypothetical protein